MNPTLWNEKWTAKGPDAAQHRHSPHQPDPLLPQLVGPWPTGRALDLGCGLGANARWLARQGWQVCGLDFSSVAIDFARRLAEQDENPPDFRVADVTTLAADETFDLVTAFYLHLSQAQRQSLLATLHQHLRPGGHVVFVAHDRSDQSWSPSDPKGPPPEILTTPEEVRAELSGLQVLRAEVILHDAHQDGRAAPVTVVVAQR